MRRQFELNTPALRPSAAVLNVMGETFLPTVKIDRGDALASLEQRYTMCSAIVDFPEPPFSLASTTTCAE